MSTPESFTACEDEAVCRYYKDTSSEDVRRYIYLCMTAQGYERPATKKVG